MIDSIAPFVDRLVALGMSAGTAADFVMAIRNSAAREKTDEIVDIFSDCVAQIRASEKLDSYHLGRVEREKRLLGECYVYALVDPRNDEIFYIGISMHPHWRYHSHRRNPNSAAHVRLSEIIEEGFDPIFNVMHKFATRQEALDCEHELVRTTPTVLNRVNPRVRLVMTGK